MVILINNNALPIEIRIIINYIGIILKVSSGNPYDICQNHASSI